MKDQVITEPLPPRHGLDVGPGKGDTPRNCNSKAFLQNYTRINWGRKKAKRK